MIKRKMDHTFSKNTMIALLSYQSQYENMNTIVIEKKECYHFPPYVSANFS